MKKWDYADYFNNGLLTIVAIPFVICLGLLMSPFIIIGWIARKARIVLVSESDYEDYF